MDSDLTITLSEPQPTPAYVFEGGELHDPLLALEHHRLGPFSKPERTKASILALFPSSYNSSEEQFVKLLATDISQGIQMNEEFKTARYVRCRYRGFKETYGGELDFAFEQFPWETEDMTSLLSQLQKHFASKKHQLTLFFSPFRERSLLGGPYYRVRAAGIDADSKIQWIRRDRVNDYDLRRKTFPRDLSKYRSYADFVWNLSLSIFTKLGGKPWKLKNAFPNVSGFMGLATVFAREYSDRYERQGIAAVELFNNWGEYESASFDGTVLTQTERGEIDIYDLDKVEDLIVRATASIAQSPTMKPERDLMVVHVSDLYSKRVKKKVMGTLEKAGFKNPRIIRVQDEGPLRLHRKADSKSRVWAPAGTYWFNEEGKLAQLFTAGLWRYSPTAEPYNIPSFTCDPVQVSIEEPTGSELTIDDLKHVFCLSKLYPYTFDVGRKRKPITLTLARRLAQFAASVDIGNKVPDITHLY